MGRPRKAEFTLKERLDKIAKAGLKVSDDMIKEDSEELEGLPDRINALLDKFDNSRLKFNEMIYLVMYDIENNKVRNAIAKYLLKKGCIRIQKSVYIVRSEKKVYDEMKQALTDIQSYYRNEDSIIILPATHNAVQSISIIGKNIELDHIIDPPNTLFI